jgi:hypothetical protein
MTQPNKPPVIEIEGDGKDMFVICDGVRIAKRGDDATWVSLEPGWSVISPPDHSTITVEYNGVKRH